MLWAFLDSHDLNFPNRTVWTRMPGGVSGVQLTDAPYASQIKMQAQIIAFNDIFNVMGRMMLAIAFMALLATKSFRLFQTSSEKC